MLQETGKKTVRSSDVEDIARQISHKFVAARGDRGEHCCLIFATVLDDEF